MDAAGGAVELQGEESLLPRCDGSTCLHGLSADLGHHLVLGCRRAVGVAEVAGLQVAGYYVAVAQQVESRLGVVVGS